MENMNGADIYNFRGPGVATVQWEARNRWLTRGSRFNQRFRELKRGGSPPARSQQGIERGLATGIA
jgi:hypothetical protein